LLGIQDFFPRIVALQGISVSPQISNGSAIVHILALWAIAGAPFSLQVSLLLSSFSLLCLTCLGPQPSCLLCLFSAHLLLSLSCGPLALLLRCMVPVHHLQEHTVKSQIWLRIWLAMVSVSVCVCSACCHCTYYMWCLSVRVCICTHSTK